MKKRLLQTSLLLTSLFMCGLRPAEGMYHRDFESLENTQKRSIHEAGEKVAAAVREQTHQLRMMNDTAYRKAFEESQENQRRLNQERQTREERERDEQLRNFIRQNHEREQSWKEWGEDHPWFATACDVGVGVGTVGATVLAVKFWPVTLGLALMSGGSIPFMFPYGGTFVYYASRYPAGRR